MKIVSGIVAFILTIVKNVFTSAKRWFVSDGLEIEWVQEPPIQRAIFLPSLPPKIQCGDYEKLRLAEITIDDLEIYDKMVTMAEKDPEFMKMVFFELVRIAPSEWLKTRLIDGYERLKEEWAVESGRPRYKADEKARQRHWNEQKLFDENLKLWMSEAKEEKPNRRWKDPFKSFRDILKRKPE
ncbi:MAG: hypothetical protein JXM69_00735 [Anaerolineae bacterium]|nr:hypothetical protein [Anaerolineae bacterium]